MRKEELPPGLSSNLYQCFYPVNIMLSLKLGNNRVSVEINLKTAPFSLSQRFALFLCTSSWLIHQGTQTDRRRLTEGACDSACAARFPQLLHVGGRNPLFSVCDGASAQATGDGNASLQLFSGAFCVCCEVFLQLFAGKLREVSLRFT